MSSAALRSLTPSQAGDHDKYPSDLIQTLGQQSSADTALTNLPYQVLHNKYPASKHPLPCHPTLPGSISIDTDTASTNPTGPTNSDILLLPQSPHDSKSDSSDSAHHPYRNPPPHHIAAGHLSRRSCQSVARDRLEICKLDPAKDRKLGD